MNIKKALWVKRPKSYITIDLHSFSWTEDAGEYKGGSVPEGFSLYSFPESEWALFSTKGPSLLPFRN